MTITPEQLLAHQIFWYTMRLKAKDFESRSFARKQLFFLKIKKSYMNAKDFKQANDCCWILDNEVDLIFSEDDFNSYGKGWYLQKGRTTSDLYLLDREAIAAWQDKSDNKIYPKELVN